jgi:ABC-type nickel/cobalt efflux system permease component RcnA
VLGLDEQLAQLSGGDTLLAVLAVALLLGLRHATDPDHLAAVSTLIASDPEEGRRRAGKLGLAWGLGHATTLVLFGLPIVVFNSYLPEGLQRAAEALVGLVIMALAIRLLVRWRQGRFHAHAHRHGDVEHRHLHPHDHGHPARDDMPEHSHRHEPEARLGRSATQAYGIGLVHGMGGSAGVGVLLLAGIPSQGEAIVALLLFAAAAAVSMAALSSGFGYALTRGPVVRRVLALAPAMGVVTLLFGAWYALGALNAVSYPL